HGACFLGRRVNWASIRPGAGGRALNTASALLPGRAGRRFATRSDGQQRHLDLDLVADADAEIGRRRNLELRHLHRELRLDADLAVLLLQLRGAGHSPLLAVQAQHAGEDRLAFSFSTRMSSMIAVANSGPFATSR